MLNIKNTRGWVYFKVENLDLAFIELWFPNSKVKLFAKEPIKEVLFNTSDFEVPQSWECATK